MIEEILYKESLFYKTYSGDVDIIQKHIDHIIEFDRGRQISNRGGYQSNDITFGFENLINFAIDSLKSINVNATLGSFWLNINQEGHNNVPHIHSAKGWSAVYYHKICCDTPKIEFHHLVPTIIYETYKFTPKEKQMIFFKQSKPHSVIPCYNEGHQRISIAFNFN